MQSPYESILKPWARNSRKPLGMIAAITFLAIFVWACLAGFGKETLGLKLAYAAWTVLVPLWFFAETLYGVDFSQFGQDGFENRYGKFKAAQDAARNVWAACAAAVGVLLLKST